MAERSQEPVLLVDDEEQFVTLLRSVLEQVIPTRHVSSGNEALRILEESRPAALVVDFMMPEISGAQLLDRALELHPGLPVVILSGYLDRVTAAHLLNSGARRIFLKPVRIIELRHHLLGLLGKGGTKPTSRPGFRPPWFAREALAPAWAQFEASVAAQRGRKVSSAWLEGAEPAVVEAIAPAFAQPNAALHVLEADEDLPPAGEARGLLVVPGADQLPAARQRQILAWLDTLPADVPGPLLLLASADGLDEALASGRLEGEFYVRHLRNLVTMPSPGEVVEDLPFLAKAEILRLAGAEAASRLDDAAASVLASAAIERGWGALCRLAALALRQPGPDALSAPRLAALATASGDAPDEDFLAAVRLLAGDDLAAAAQLLSLDPITLGNHA